MGEWQFRGLTGLLGFLCVRGGQVFINWMFHWPHHGDEMAFRSDSLGGMGQEHCLWRRLPSLCWWLPQLSLAVWEWSVCATARQTDNLSLGHPAGAALLCSPLHSSLRQAVIATLFRQGHLVLRAICPAGGAVRRGARALLASPAVLLLRHIVSIAVCLTVVGFTVRWGREALQVPLWPPWLWGLCGGWGSCWFRAEYLCRGTEHGWWREHSLPWRRGTLEPRASLVPTNYPVGRRKRGEWGLVCVAKLEGNPGVREGYGLGQLFTCFSGSTDTWSVDTKDRLVPDISYMLSFWFSASQLYGNQVLNTQKSECPKTIKNLPSLISSPGISPGEMNSCIASIPRTVRPTLQPAACQQRTAGAQLSHCTPAAPEAETGSNLQILAPPNCFSSDWGPKKSVLFVCSNL